MANRSSQDSPSATTTVDQQLVISGLQKERAGGKLTRQEQSAVRRWRADKEEADRWTYYRSVPQKHYRLMSGRQTKVLHEQAARYGIPFDGKTIDLRVVLKGFHDLFAKHAKLFRVDDEGMVGPTSPALERYREYKADLLKMELLEREGTMLHRDKMHDAHTRLASILRRAGETLKRRCGREAHLILNEALDSVEREITALFSDGGDARRTK